MRKKQIKNRYGLELFLTIHAQHNKKLVFIVHGLGGWKEEDSLEIIRDMYIAHGFCVVMFDTSNSFGESEGDISNASVSSSLHDLEDVVAWTREQNFYTEPFMLAGHSLGGITSIIFTEKNTEKINGLFALSTIVSGKMWKKHRTKRELLGWRLKGSVRKTSGYDASKSGELKYNIVKDMMRYDGLKDAHNILCPVLLLVGSLDETTPPIDHQKLFGALPASKELHIIDGMRHTPQNEEYRLIVADFLDSWLDRNSVAKPNRILSSKFLMKCMRLFGVKTSD